MVNEEVISKGGCIPIKIKEIFNGRWDRTSEMKGADNKWKRRLDSISRLIQGDSMCAAVAVEENSFLIAKNEKFEDTSTASGYRLVNDVMTFFQEVAQRKYDEDTDTYRNKINEIVRQIFFGAVSGLQGSAYVRDKIVNDSFVKRITELSKRKKTADAREVLDFFSEKREFGHNPAAQGAAFALCLALMRDFNKTLKFIVVNRDKSDFSQDEVKIGMFIKAVKNYKSVNFITDERLASKILNADTREKMHAEMKVIALFEEKLKKKGYHNYIGISKLCCLDCHAMIYAVSNAVGYKNHIEIRGAHNVEHTGNWNAPFGITGNLAAINENEKLKPPKSGDKARRSVPDDPFAVTVIAQFEIARKKAGSFMKGQIRAAGAKDVSEEPDLSQTSDEEGEDYYEQYCSYLSSRQKTLQLRKKVSPDDKNISEEMNIVAVGLDICKNQVFKDICKIEFKDLGSAKKFAIESDLRQLLGLVKNEKLLIEFLQNPVYAGQKISSYFSSIDLNQTKDSKRRKASIT